MCPRPSVLAAGRAPLPCSRLAKATLTLIPLFGIHEVVFIFATDEQTTGILRYVKVFFSLFLNSFQVRWEPDISLPCPGHTSSKNWAGGGGVCVMSLFQLVLLTVPQPPAGLREGNSSSPVVEHLMEPPVLSEVVVAGRPWPPKRPGIAWGD